MKLPISFLSCIAALRLVAAQDGGYLYAIDKSIQSSSTATINADIASSIIARRRGLTDSTYLNINDENLLGEINTFGGYQKPLFGETAKSEAPAKLFVRISGYNGDVFQLSNAMPDLWIENPTQDLQDDFKATDRHQEGLCEYNVPISLNVRNGQGVEILFTYPLNKETSCLSASEIPYIPVIMSLHAVLPSNPAEVPTKIGPLVRILKHLSATENIESTVLLLPTKMAKKESHHQSQHQHHARAAQSEEALGSEPVTPTTHTGNIVSPAATNLTLPSIIPEFYTSEVECNKVTNNCSGHGSCYERYSKHFRCKCGSTTVREYSDGTSKSVQWGGNACEKKDISVPFLLFASIGITLTALIAGGLGLLYSMGAQELPSVLSAGVAGSRK